MKRKCECVKVYGVDFVKLVRKCDNCQKKEVARRGKMSHARVVRPPHTS